jgi:hypothetical protein
VALPGIAGTCASARTRALSGSIAARTAVRLLARSRHDAYVPHRDDRARRRRWTLCIQHELEEHASKLQAKIDRR